MAVNLGTAYIQIQPSTKGLIPAIKSELGGITGISKEAGQKGGDAIADGMGKNMKGGMPKLGDILKGAVGAFAALKVGQVIGEQLMSGITGAAEVEQSRGGLAVIFEKDTKKMGDQAKKAATTMGLTEDAYNKLASGVGAIFKGQGMDTAKYTTDMLKRSADVAATFGGSTSEAQEAMSAGMRGEYNALEKYGVVLTGSMVQQELVTRGQDKLTGAKLEAAKAEARYSILMEQTSDAQGQFASESDTMAGQQERMGAQWENLKAKIGMGFLPIITTVMSFITGKVIPGIESFVSGFKGGEGGVGAFVGVLRDNLMPIFSAVAGFVTGTLVPNIQLIAGIIWSTVKPAFDQLIGLLVTRVFPALKDLANFLIVNVLPVLQLVFEKVFIPLLKGLAAVIGWVFNTIVMPILKLVIAYLTDVLIPVWKWVFTEILIPIIKKLADTFTWLYDNVIKPVASRIGSDISWLADNVFKPMFSKIGDLLSDFGSAWGNIWSGIQEAAAKPVNFVIETIWNNGLRKVIGMIPGVKEPGRINPVSWGKTDSWKNAPGGRNNGYAEGGWTGAGPKYQEAGIVHADEYVINKAARRSLERSNPGALDYMNAKGSMPGYATGGHVKPVNTSNPGKTYPKHTGLDFAMPSGSPVRATYGGTITSTPRLAGSYGLHIKQQLDNGLEAIYAHLSRVGVTPGQKVTGGQVIGAVGSTGNSTGPHLHFEVGSSTGRTSTVGSTRAWLNGSTPIGGGSTAGMEDAPNPLLTSIPKAWKTVTGGLSQLVGPWGDLIKSGISDAVEKAFKWVTDKVPGLSAIMDFLGGTKIAKVGTKGAGDHLPTGGYATGTNSAARGPAWVGENGPEIVNFRGGEKVYTAEQSASLGTTVHIENVSLPGIKTLEDLIAFAEELPNARRHGHMIGSY